MQSKRTKTINKLLRPNKAKSDQDLAKILINSGILYPESEGETMHDQAYFIINVFRGNYK